MTIDAEKGAAEVVAPDVVDDGLRRLEGLKLTVTGEAAASFKEEKCANAGKADKNLECYEITRMNERNELIRD